MLAIFKILSLLDSAKKFAIIHLSYFLPYVNYVATLPCKTWNATFIILPHYICFKNLDQYSFFTWCNSYYLTRITITYFWLNSHCLSCVRSVLSSLSSSETMCQLNECAQPPCQCLPLQTIMFISSGLWPQHLHLNPLTIKFA